MLCAAEPRKCPAYSPGEEGLCSAGGGEGDVWTAEQEILASPVNREVWGQEGPEEIISDQFSSTILFLILWSPDVKTQLIGKDPDIGKIEGRRRRGHWLNGHEFEQTPGNSEGQGSWHSTAHGVPGSRAWLSNYTTTTVTTPAQVGLVASLPPLIMFLHSLDKHFLNSWFALGQTKLIHNMTLTVIYHWLMLNTKHSRCCSKNFLIVISFNPHIKTQWVNSRIISILQMRKQRWNNSLRVT